MHCSTIVSMVEWGNFAQGLQPPWLVAMTMALAILPGWPWARRQTDDRLLRLCLSLAGSFFLVGSAEMLVYALRLPAPLAGLLCLLLAGAGAVDVFKSWRTQRIVPMSRVGLLAWASLILWLLGWQYQTVVYGLPESYGDWLSHYQRSITFLDHESAYRKYLGFYSLAARGPLFNAIAAAALRLGGSDRFESYQVVATVLNSWQMLPFALLLRDFARVRLGPAFVISVLYCGLMPIALINELPTFTKAFTVGFILLAFYLFANPMQRGEAPGTSRAMGILAVGFLAHFMAFLYAAGLALFAAGRAVARPSERPAILYSAVLWLAITGGWFLFLFSKFGIAGTFSANTTIGSAYAQQQLGRQDADDWGEVALANLQTTLIPMWIGESVWYDEQLIEYPPIQEVSLVPRVPPDQSFVRHRVQNGYEEYLALGSLPGSMGRVGSLAFFVALAIFASVRFRTRQPLGALHWLWIAVALVGVPLNIWPLRVPAPFGMAPLNLQPILFLATLFCVSQWHKLPRAWQFGCALAWTSEALYVAREIHRLLSLPIPIRAVGPGDVIQITDPARLPASALENFALGMSSGVEYLSASLAPLAGWTAEAYLLLGLVGLSALFGRRWLRRVERRAFRSQPL
jgi:hypothetical protein